MYYPDYDDYGLDWHCDVDDDYDGYSDYYNDSDDDDYDDSKDSDPPSRYHTRTYYVKDGRARSSEHSVLLEKRLYEMFLSSDDCDVTLHVGGTVINAHKIILKVNSDYFKAMFSSSCSEGLNSSVSFEDNPYITQPALAAIVEFSYRGSFEINESNVCDILEAARYLLMPDVTKLCKTFLEDIKVTSDNFMELAEVGRYFDLGPRLQERCNIFVRQIGLTTDNCATVLEFAQLSRSNDLTLLLKVTNFILPKLQVFLQSPGLHVLDTINASTLLEMVKSDTLCFFTDMNLIKFIVKWAECAEDRTQHVADMMKAINLLCFDEDQLDVIIEMKFLRDDETCMELIATAKSRLLEITNGEIESLGKDDTYLVSITNSYEIYEEMLNLGLMCLASKTMADLLIPSEPLLNIHCNEIGSTLLVNDLMLMCFRGERLDSDTVLTSSGDQAVTKALLFDLQRAKWRVSDHYPFHASSAKASVHVNDTVYMIGGREIPDGVKIYNLELDEWRIGTSVPASSDVSAAASHDGKIYVCSRGKKSSANQFLMYDPTRQVWEDKSRCSSWNAEGATLSGLASGNEGLYLFLNWYGRDHFDIQHYNPSTEQWTPFTADLSHPIKTIERMFHVDSPKETYMIAKYQPVIETTSNENVSLHQMLYGPPTHVRGLFEFDEGNRRITLVKEIKNWEDTGTCIARIPKWVVDRMKVRKMEESAHLISTYIL